MARESVLAAPVREKDAVLNRLFAGPAVLSDFWAITKPEVTLLIAVTTGTSFYVGSSAAAFHVAWIPLLHALVATVVVASGAAALNQWMEYPFDARMRRTARRPIASGRIDPTHALMFGAVLSLAGLVYLILAANVLSGLLALVTLVGYLGFYTPLKRITPLCTLVGAIPGALPTLIGWAAARGHLDPEAWVLFCMVFLWQFPHFMSIAWMYRDDYARAGYLVLPDSRTRARLVNVQTLLPLAGLLPVSLLPARSEDASVWYAVGALALGLGFLYFGAQFARRKSGPAARRLLMASIIYLPALLMLMILLA